MDQHRHRRRISELLPGHPVDGFEVQSRRDRSSFELAVEASKLSIEIGEGALEAESMSETATRERLRIPERWRIVWGQPRLQMDDLRAHIVELSPRRHVTSSRGPRRRAGRDQ